MTVLKESESQIQNAICEYLDWNKHCFFRLNNIPAFNRNESGGISMRALPKYTPRGLPDIVVIKEGKFIAIEVKSKIGKQSPEQAHFQQKIESHGAEYHIVRSIDDVKRIGL